MNTFATSSTFGTKAYLIFTFEIGRDFSQIQIKYI